MTRTLATLFAALTLLTGCSNPTGTDEANSVADDARTKIDALAADVGTVVEVQRDVLIDCIPGDKDSGKELSYAVRVDPDAGAFDRIRGKIADKSRADGWAVYPRGDENTAFRKDNVTVVVAEANDGGAVYDDGMIVSGTGGCVK